MAVLEPLDEAQRNGLRAAVTDERSSLYKQESAWWQPRADKESAEINRASAEIKRLRAEENLSPHEAQQAWLARRRGHKPRERNPYTAPIAAAVLAGWGVSSSRDVAWDVRAGDDGQYERLARSRGRSWRQTIAETSGALPIGWVLRMARDGLVERPTSDAFLLETLGDKSVVDDPAWSETEVWQYFEIESVAERLSTVNCWVPWPSLVGEAAQAGKLPRERLLDTALAGLRRDFAFKNTRWHRAVYVALEPTPAEQAQRAGDLIALLASDDRLNVAFALDQLTAAADVPAGELLAALEPALTSRVQAHAVSAVRLVGLVLQAHPEAAPAGAQALVGALGHRKRAVQSAALKLLEGHAGGLRDDDRERVSACAGTVDPGLRSRVFALSGGAAEVALPPTSAPPIPPAIAPDRHAPRLRHEDLLEPIATPQELLERALDALQGEPDADEIELVIDGVFRLVDQPMDTERLAALLATHRVTDPGRESAAAVLRSVLRAQLHRDTHTPVYPACRAALRLRLSELEHPLEAPRQLMSIPTHRGGWIDPRTAVARLAAATERPWHGDLAQMLLRLAPDHRAEALGAVGPPPGDVINALLTHALGGPAATPADVHGERMLLDAARCAREHDRPTGPWDPDTAARRLRPSSGDYARRWVMTRELPPVCPAALIEYLDEGAPLLRGTAQQLLRVWPANRESCYRMVALRLWLGHYPEDPDDGLPPILAVLLDPSEPVGPSAALAIAFSFAAEDPLLRTLAVDVAIAVLADRRCDGDALGAALVRVLHDRRPSTEGRAHYRDAPKGDIKVTRWAEPLERIAGAGPLQAHDVQTMLERVLAAAGDNDRRALAGSVDLLRRLAMDADAAVTDDAARSWLARYSPRTAGGRAARELLAISGAGAARRHAAIAQVMAAAAQTSRCSLD